jgi:type VI protein secretion system component VasF
MTTQYSAKKHRGPEQHDLRQQGQEPTWEQYPARRSTPWGVIMAVGAAIVVACTFALVFLFAHSSTSTPSTSTPASTSGSNQPAPVNPAVPTHPAS